MRLEFAEIMESDVPELTQVMTRAFDDDAQRHVGEERGGPEGYDNGEFFGVWLFGYEWTRGYKVVSEGCIIGGIIVWIFESGENILGTLFIDPDQQGRGVGQATWAFVESTYPDTRSWKLETPSLATKNHHFYEKCGFQKTDVKPTKGGLPCESWVYRKEMGIA